MKRNDNANILWVWTALCFMLTIFEPSSLYFMDKNEYWFDFYTMLPRCLGMFAVICIAGDILIFLILTVFTKVPQIRAIICGGILGVFAAFYIQGNFMIRDLPMVSGGYVDWSLYQRQIVESNILWIVSLILGISVAYILQKKRVLGKSLRYIGILSIAFLMLSAVLLGIQNDGFSRHIRQSTNLKDLWEYSQEQNFVILVMDAVDGDTEERVLEDYPRFKKDLSDFTDYTNVLSSYAYTQMALPFMLAGEWYEYSEEYDEFAGRSFTKNALVRRLKSEDYKLDLYTDEIPARYYDMNLYDNVAPENGKIKSNIGFCKLWLRLVGFKYAPYILKRYSQIFPWEFAQTGENKDGYAKVPFYDSNLYFYHDLLDESVAKKLIDQKCFKIIHLEGAHLPIWYHMDLTYEYGVETSYYENVGASNTIISAYIDELKRLGVYDNTILIITSDHGYNEEDGDVYYGRQHPMLFIKGLNEHHEEMNYSDAPISQIDFPDMYQKLLDGVSSDKVFRYADEDKRSRRFLLCTYDDILIETFTTGHARDTDALETSGIEYYP